MHASIILLLGLTLYVCSVILRMRRDLEELREMRWDAQAGVRTESWTADAETAVILCVRGADPSLASCLEGLMRQTHGNFSVHAVVDHESDPAKPLLEKFRASDPRVHVHQFNNQPPSHRGLKVTAILHAARQLAPTVEHVAFIDGDVIADPEWLRELTAPLADPQVGACSGTRWFEAKNPTLGSLVRTEWSFYATAVMARYRILWGGSFAMRLSTLREAIRAGVWEHKLCEDTCLTDYFRALGRRTVIVPSVAMINPENCTLPGAASFICRQEIFTWLYTSSSHWILGFGIVFTSLCVVIVTGLLLSPFFAPPAVAAMFVLAYLMLHGSVIYLEAYAHRLPKLLRGEEPSPLPAPLWKLCVVQVLCAGISLFTCLRAMASSGMTWRGIYYKILRNPTRIEMLGYRPFIETSATHGLTEMQQMSI